LKVQPVNTSTARCLALAGALLAATGAQAANLTVTVTNEQGQPLADAVVALELKGNRAVAAAGTRADLGQRNRAFEPPLLVVQTGTAVSFPNFDTVRHHVYSFSPIKTFEIKLYAGTPAAPVVFDKPGIAALGCNIHDKMLAHIVVVDTPHFTRTDAKGQATLQVPAGDHVLKIWHPGMGEKPMLSMAQKVADGGTAAAIKLASN
jgi:plastocyanin